MYRSETRSRGVSRDSCCRTKDLVGMSGRGKEPLDWPDLFWAECRDTRRHETYHESTGLYLARPGHADS